MNRQMDPCQPGIALALTVLIVAAVAVLASGAILMGMNSGLVRDYYVTQDQLGYAADGALEEARAQLNSNRALYPESSYVALESDEEVRDAEGNVIPSLRRSTFVGPIGVTSGQYGVVGSIVSVARSGPNTVVRREQIVQESFAKFAYFTDVEPSDISFGGGDQLFGPVHSNDAIRILSSGATFFGPVTTAENVVDSRYGSFREGYTENAADIPLPDIAELERLEIQGIQGGTAFYGTTTAATGVATTRIEFVAIDLNADGDTRDDNEGFIRVYQSADPYWVVGSTTASTLEDVETCGDVHSGAFVSAVAHAETERVRVGGRWVYVPLWGHDFETALTSASRRCYLGGAPEIYNGFRVTDPEGRWLTRAGTPSPLLSGRPDRQQLFPITRALNASFKGLIYVDGDVAISGILRGRVTVAATGDIIIADDITYSIDPSVGSCEDILGLFAGGNIVVADNPLNAPKRPDGSGTYYTYDDSSDEFIHAFVLTMNQFMAQNHSTGSSSAERCQTTGWGRGCLYLTGGIIQRQRGPVGTSGGTGYLKRYSYDACGATAPPPYFPTTGHFARSAFYDIDPTGFDIDSYFRMLTAGR